MFLLSLIAFNGNFRLDIRIRLKKIFKYYDPAIHLYIYQTIVVACCHRAGTKG